MEIINNNREGVHTKLAFNLLSNPTPPCRQSSFLRYIRETFISYICIYMYFFDIPHATLTLTKSFNLCFSCIALFIELLP